MSLYQKSINTKAGNMIAIADETHLLLLHFINKADIKKERSYLIRTTNQDILDESNNVLNQLEQELNLYFEGKLDKFTVPMKFNFGTPFQQKVWQALCDIPYGETISYKQLAENIGQPTAFRAVANANGKNHLTILVPCHRVIAADGGLGGYSSGIERKELILNIEKSI